MPTEDVVLDSEHVLQDAVLVLGKYNSSQLWNIINESMDSQNHLDGAERPKSTAQHRIVFSNMVPTVMQTRSHQEHLLRALQEQRLETLSMVEPVSMTVL